MDFNELLELAYQLGIPVERCSLWLSAYHGGPIGQLEKIRTTSIAFVLAHEIAHATGAYSRLKRPAMTMARPSGWWLSRTQSTIVRAEEAICDQVAACLTGKQRNETAALVGPYPPVTTQTRTEKYVNVRAYEALEYLMPYIQQIQERSKHDMKHESPVVTHNPDGTLTRQGAMIEAQKKYGDLGMISSDEQRPYLVWKIGEFDKTVGRGMTWERALHNARESTKEDV